MKRYLKPLVRLGGSLAGFLRGVSIRNNIKRKKPRQSENIPAGQGTNRRCRGCPGSHPCSCGSYGRQLHRRGSRMKSGWRCFGRDRCPWPGTERGEPAGPQRGRWNRRRRSHRWRGRWRNRQQHRYIRKCMLAICRKTLSLTPEFLGTRLNRGLKAGTGTYAAVEAIWPKRPGPALCCCMGGACWA